MGRRCFRQHFESASVGILGLGCLGVCVVRCGLYHANRHRAVQPLMLPRSHAGDVLTDFRIQADTKLGSGPLTPARLTCMCLGSQSCALSSQDLARLSCSFTLSPGSSSFACDGLYRLFLLIMPLPLLQVSIVDYHRM